MESNVGKEEERGVKSRKKGKETLETKSHSTTSYRRV